MYDFDVDDIPMHLPLDAVLFSFPLDVWSRTQAGENQTGICFSFPSLLSVHNVIGGASSVLSRRGNLSNRYAACLTAKGQNFFGAVDL
jgi:hypothetical protein